MPKISFRNELTARLGDGSNLAPLKNKFIHQTAAELFDAKAMAPTGQLLSRSDISDEISRRRLGSMTMPLDSRGVYGTSRIVLEHTEWTLHGYSSSEKKQGMHLVMQPGDYEFTKDVSFVSASQLVDFLAEADSLFLQWSGGDWDAYVVECRKRLIGSKITNTAVEALVKSRLAGTGIKFYVVHQAVQTKIVFLIAQKQLMEFSFATSSFRNQIDNAVDAAMQVNDIVTKLGKPMKLTRCSVLDQQSTMWIEC